jgi:UDP-glucuronate decarboxylase
MKKESIWITGSRGFIGKHLVQKLKKYNYNVLCFTNNPNLNIGKGIKEHNLHYMDYSSRVSIQKKLQTLGCPDIFIHNGWGDMANPMSELHLINNVEEGETLIETLYSEGLGKFIFLGSMNEYGARLGSLSEDMEPKGRLTNYAKGKIEVAKFGLQRSVFFGRYFIHIRPFYVYGPGQKKGSLINTLFDAFQNETTAKLGPCKHYRDYIYVKDVAEGIMRLLIIDKSCTINLGSESFILVKDFVKKFWTEMGGDMSSLEFGRRPMSEDEPEQPKSYADLSRLKRFTGWTPEYSLEDGVQETIKLLRQ